MRDPSRWYWFPDPKSFLVRGAVPSGLVQSLSLLCLLLLAACARTETHRAASAAPEQTIERSDDAGSSSDGTTTSPGGSCSHGLRLEGMLAVPTCPENGEGCRYGRDAVNAYAEHIDSPPHEFSVLVASSPWRFYSGDGRILTIEALTTELRTSFKPEVREVVLYASWSGIAPEAHVRSLARQVSDALDGFPVRGLDGFMWLEPDGRVRTTQQAFSGWYTGGGYRVAPDQPVLTSLAFGEMMFYNERLREADEYGLLLHAAVGWDVHGLCPERALAEFELIAPHHPIAAYNAALMRLASGKAEDRATALRLLEVGENAGDEAARELRRRLLSP